MAGRHFARRNCLAEYNRADLFCLPSVQEGFGIVLLEAMAAGKPIVASRAAAIPEVAPHAVLVEPDSPEALAAAIEALYRSPETRAALGAAGAQWVEQFDAPRVARRFLEAVAGDAPGRAIEGLLQFLCGPRPDGFLGGRAARQDGRPGRRRRRSAHPLCARSATKSRW